MAYTTGDTIRVAFTGTVRSDPDNIDGTSQVEEMTSGGVGSPGVVHYLYLNSRRARAQVVGDGQFPDSTPGPGDVITVNFTAGVEDGTGPDSTIRPALR